MKKTWIHSILLPFLIVSIGGFILVGLAWIAYCGIVLGIEALFYSGNPGEVPMGEIRNASALLFAIAGFALLRTRIPDLAKATILVGPLTTLQIALILQLYMTPFIAAGVVLFLAGVCVLLIRLSRKPWFFYLGVGLSSLMAVWYAWPVQ